MRGHEFIEHAHTRVQQCSQFDITDCQNPAEIVHKIRGQDIYIDFCAMHNHMDKTGIPLKCWRCGDRR